MRSSALLPASNSTQQPLNEQDLGKISGVGPKKLALYGEAFLAVLNE